MHELAFSAVPGEDVEKEVAQFRADCDLIIVQSSAIDQIRGFSNVS